MRAKLPEFKRGVLAAAAVADDYNSTSIHGYRLGDCIAWKFNATRRKPRKNKHVLEAPGNAWIKGFATALAEMHRLLIAGGDSAGVRAVAKGACLTLAMARAAGVSPFDLKELRKAGVR